MEQPPPGLSQDTAPLASRSQTPIIPQTTPALPVSSTSSSPHTLSPNPNRTLLDDYPQSIQYFPPLPAPVQPLPVIPDSARSHQPSPTPGLHSRAPSRSSKHGKTRTPRSGTPAAILGTPGLDSGLRAASSMAMQGGVGPGGPVDNRQLEVQDALTYLDDVKSQFHDKPDVYNHFLDIMKEFKSQSIDTPGVITRVSFLFRGYPELIQGFNTFLPPGYRIECSNEDDVINVTTPDGGTKPLGLNKPRMMANGIPLDPYTFQPLPTPPAFLSSRVGTPLGQTHSPQPFRPDPLAPFSPGLHGTTNAASFLGNLNPAGMGGRMVNEKQGDYDHAMDFIGKIKQRFSNDQETYKRFLEVLQTYQKTKKPWKESHVYQEVQQLFADAPDLVVEFKSFLPEFGAVVDFGSDYPMAESSKKDTALRKKADPPNKRRKKAVDKEPPLQSKTSRSKKAKHNHKPEPQSPTFAAYQGQASPPPHGHPPPAPQHPHAHYQQQQYQLAPEPGSYNDKILFFERIKKTLDPFAHDELLRLLNLYASDVIDAKRLIERATEFLGGRDSDLTLQFKEMLFWDDRLQQGPPGSMRTAAVEYAVPIVLEGSGPSYRKVPEMEARMACSGRDAHCYSVLNDEVISHPTWAADDVNFMVLKRGTHEEVLFRCEDERHDYHTHLNWMQSTIAVLEPIALRLEELPPEERAAFRLGPDFGGSSKSIYHRLLKKVYPQAFHEILRSLQETPAVAVPVVLARLKGKHEEWRKSHRELCKVWREIDQKNYYKGLDFFSSFFKQNDKKNITAKQFVLEIEGAKTGAPSTGGTPLENINNKRSRSKGKAKQVDLPPPSDAWHLEYPMSDIGTIQDTLKLVYAYLDRAGAAQYAPRERRAIEKFLRAFVPVLCMLSVAEFDAQCGPSMEGSGPRDVLASAELSDAEENGEAEGGDDGPAKGPRRNANGMFVGGGAAATVNNSGVQPDDLRKRLLKTTRGSTQASPSGSATGSPTMSPRQGTSRLPRVDTTDGAEQWNTNWSVENGVGHGDTWIREAIGDLAKSETGDASIDTRAHRPFWANTTFYTLLRLLHLMYHRLTICKDLGAKLSSTRGSSLRPNPIAASLGFVDPVGPYYVYEKAEKLASPDSNAVLSGEEWAALNPPYLYLLESVEKTFDAEMDPSLFEEHMRYLFGSKAYNLFTLDKLCAALIKQVQQALQDHRCQELWRLLRRERATSTGQDANTERRSRSGLDKVRYRRAADQHVGTDEHLYRVEWDTQMNTLRIQLVGPLDPSIDEARDPQGRWREYVDTYVSRYPTEWLPTPVPAAATASGGGVRAPVFLRRTLQKRDSKNRGGASIRNADPNAARGDVTIVGECRSAVRISLGTYRLFYEAGSEDFLWIVRGAEEHSLLSARAAARKEEASRCALLL